MLLGNEVGVCIVRSVLGCAVLTWTNRDARRTGRRGPRARGGRSLLYCATHALLRVRYGPTRTLPRAVRYCTTPDTDLGVLCYGVPQ
eukprot:1260346-Rhodomonas_salina.1